MKLVIGDLMILQGGTKLAHLNLMSLASNAWYVQL